MPNVGSEKINMGYYKYIYYIYAIIGTIIIIAITSSPTNQSITHWWNNQFPDNNETDSSCYSKKNKNDKISA